MEEAKNSGEARTRSPEEEDLLRMEEDDVEPNPPPLPDTAGSSAASAAAAAGTNNVPFETGAAEAWVAAADAGGNPRAGPSAGADCFPQGGITTGTTIFQTNDRSFSQSSTGRNLTGKRNVYGSALKKLTGTALPVCPSRTSGSTLGSPIRVAQFNSIQRFFIE